MSAKYTKNYKLCQWEPGDKVLRTDFNEDNAKLEAALAKISASADGAGAAVRELAGKAYTANFLPVEFGTYSGRQAGGTTTVQYINLGYQPRAVIVVPSHFGGAVQTSDGRWIRYGGFSQTVAETTTTLNLTKTGFCVANRSDYSSQTYLNLSGTSYIYFALR